MAVTANGETGTANPARTVALDKTPVFDVLVIDDDPAGREVMLEALGGRGYSTCWAANGRDALEMLAAHRFRLIITDIFMPHVDGIELIIAATRSHPTVPLLAISGGGWGGAPERVLRPARMLGSRRTLAKPFELRELFAVVADLLGENSSRL